MFHFAQERDGSVATAVSASTGQRVRGTQQQHQQQHGQPAPDRQERSG